MSASLHTLFIDKQPLLLTVLELGLNQVHFSSMKVVEPLLQVCYHRHYLRFGHVGERILCGPSDYRKISPPSPIGDVDNSSRICMFQHDYSICEGFVTFPFLATDKMYLRCIHETAPISRCPFLVFHFEGSRFGNHKLGNAPEQ